MKYWEAMLKGSKLRPQAFVSMFDGQGTCAVGAMFEGFFGKKALESCHMDAWRLVEDLNYKFGQIECPVCHISWQMGNTLWHLNDIHKWSRENIAYFLRSVEEPNRTIEEKKNVEELVA